MGDKPDDLDDIFKEHQKRKQSEKEQTFARDVEIARLTDACKKRLHEIAEPALERLVEQIRSHGQRASVDSRPTAISLSFTPEPTPGHSFAACTIGFSCEGSGDVSVTTTIYGKGGRQGGTSQQALASLTDEWVTRRVQEFVRTVLAGT